MSDWVAWCMVCIPVRSRGVQWSQESVQDTRFLLFQTWQTMYSWSFLCVQVLCRNRFGPRSSRERNLQFYSKQKHPIKLCASNVVAIIWERTTYGSTRFKPSRALQAKIAIAAMLTTSHVVVNKLYSIICSVVSQMAFIQE